jgi:hypothetical protein
MLITKEKRTEIIIRICKFTDGKKWHSDWCELITGLWHECDCGFTQELEWIVDWKIWLKHNPAK